MSWEHGTYGFERYENFCSGLAVAGVPYAEEEKQEEYVRGWDGECVCYCGYIPGEPVGCPCCEGTCGHKQKLRIARFTAADGKRMVVEEYRAIEDLDCDGADIITIATYPEGERPELATEQINE